MKKLIICFWLPKKFFKEPVFLMGNDFLASHECKKLLIPLYPDFFEERKYLTKTQKCQAIQDEISKNLDDLEDDTEAVLIMKAGLKDDFLEYCKSYNRKCEISVQYFDAEKTSVLDVSVCCFVRDVNDPQIASLGLVPLAEFFQKGEIKEDFTVSRTQHN